MGRFVSDVECGHLTQFPQEVEILKPFTLNFDITWARRSRVLGSELSVYLLKPETHMELSFGFVPEILTVYSAYDTLQPRTIQAIDQLITEEPARGRVDTMIAFVISESADPVSWSKQYMSSNPASRLIVAFSASTLRRVREQSWLIRSLLAEQLYQRDLFDYRLPINSDYFFFGREELLFDLYNAFRRSENRGLFGLRKTGKTSTFFKLRRQIESEDGGVFVYVDCKYPPFRTLRWEQFLARLSKMLSEHADDFDPAQHEHVSDAFLAVIRSIGERSRIVIVFDEIEFISPYSPLDRHWTDDFLPFWQTIWHAQSLFGNFAVFLGGVNPKVVEEDLIGHSQNPLFGIVPPRYVGGLSVAEVRRMLRALGRPMGLRFDQDSVIYISERYGGHPLLTRIACSISHRLIGEKKDSRPASVAKDWLLSTESQREAELSYYCSHVVSEFSVFYPDEYELITRMANGNLADVYEFALEPSFTNHLINYGLLKTGPTGRPMISIPVVEQFVRRDDARKRGQRTILFVQSKDSRKRWLGDRVRSINDNLERLQTEISRLNQPKLFGINSYPESHRFFSLRVVRDESGFATFINTCNRCFVEPVETYGKSIEKRDYFWNVICRTYPELAQALRRIKVYRHNRVHIKLGGAAIEELRHFLKRDLHNKNPSDIPDLWFHLQQCVIDDLLVGILIETDRLN